MDRQKKEGKTGMQVGPSLPFLGRYPRSLETQADPRR